MKAPNHLKTHNREMAAHIGFLRAINDTDMDEAQLAQVRPKPTAFSEMTSVQEVRGKVMDLRGKKPKLLQTNAPVDCQIDADYLEESLPGHKDKQLQQFLRHGVRSQTDLPLQTVLQSHLLSSKSHRILGERHRPQTQDKVPATTQEATF